MRVRFIPPARKELIGEGRYYDRRLPGLGDAFLDEAARTIERIKQFPKAAPEDEATRTRRARMQRFPFSIVYRVESAEIVIIAVAHAKRRQYYWKRRAIPSRQP